MINPADRISTKNDVLKLEFLIVGPFLQFFVDIERNICPDEKEVKRRLERNNNVPDILFPI
jgi:hypothetical protein